MAQTLDLLAVAGSPDPTPFLTAPLPTLDLQLGLPQQTLENLFSYASNFSEFTTAYQNVASSSTARVPANVSSDLANFQSLLATAYPAAVAANASNQNDPNVMALIEMLAVLDDAVDAVLATPAVLGAEITNAGALAVQALSYQVRQGDTLEGIALAVLGDPEQWVNIARYNDLNLDVVDQDGPLNTWVGTIIGIPVPNGSAPLARDPSVWDAVVGTRALGSNWGCTLTLNTRPDGTADFTVLPPTNTVLEGLSARLMVPLGGLPDAPQFGSYTPLILGQSFGDMTPGVIQANMIAALLADPRVSEVTNFQMTVNGSAITILFQLTLFNGLTLNDLWASFDTQDYLPSNT